MNHEVYVILVYFPWIFQFAIFFLSKFGICDHQIDVINLFFSVVIGFQNNVWSKVVILRLPKPETLRWCGETKKNTWNATLHEFF